MAREAAAPVFDVDQHYYEPLDAFTRHLPKGWAERTVLQTEVDGRVRFLVGGKLNKSVSNPTFNPISPPGTLADYFRGNVEQKTIAECLKTRIPIPASFRNREARIKVMDEQQVQNCWLLPTLGMAYEEDLQLDPKAASVAFHAFNEWLLDDWGFEYEGRIFSAPYLAMGDVDAAVKEVDWALKNGARLFAVRCSGVYTEGGWKSPGDAMFDPIWSRINEAGAVVGPHTAEVGGYGLERYLKHGESIIGGGGMPPLEAVVGFERATGNYLGALVCDKLFERFPKLRIVSLENGSDFLPNLLKGLKRAGFLIPGYFKSDPRETFLKHVWVSPFWEDDLNEVIGWIGVDRVVFGSDWPHCESLPLPRDYEHEVAQLGDPVAERKIMYENAAYLTGLN